MIKIMYTIHKLLMLLISIHTNKRSMWSIFVIFLHCLFHVHINKLIFFLSWLIKNIASVIAFTVLLMQIPPFTQKVYSHRDWFTATL